jgi:uncharacterized membrane-anchored protein
MDKRLSLCIILVMSKRKIENRPIFAFLLALTANIVIFTVNWEPIVQGHASSLVHTIFGMFLYLFGLSIFYWSSSTSRRQKSETWKNLSDVALVLIVLWIALYLFSLVIGYFWGEAWDQFK